MRKSNFLLIVFSPVMYGSFALAHADENIYKYRSSGGAITYSQERSGSGELEEVIRVPSTPKAVSKRIAQRELQEDKAKAEALATERRERQAAEARVEQAEQAVSFAELALASSLEPLPEERQATVGGNSRITDAYWMRMRAMQLSIDLAREQLELVTAEVQTR